MLCIISYSYGEQCGPYSIVAWSHHTCAYTRARTHTFTSPPALNAVKPSTCSSYIISWLGFLPMQVVMTATAIANAYMTMPKRPDQTSILQVGLI